MLLAIDLGNTSLKVTIFKEDEIVASNIYDSAQEDYGALIKNFLYRNNLSENSIEDTIVSSVVPDSLSRLHASLLAIFNKEPIIVDINTETGISVDTPNPSEVGSDLIVLSSYAHHLYPNDDVFIVSLGTASVIAHVSKKGTFKHCIIAPGYGKLAQTLWGNAAKLPQMDQSKIHTFIANTTIDAMNVGIYQGYIGSLRYLIAGLKGELKIEPKIIACGGHGKEVVNDIKEIEYYEPDMVITGLNYIYRKYIKHEINIG